MSPVFDGLRSILGNNELAVPQVAAEAVEQPVVSTSSAEPPVDTAPAGGAGAASSHELADIPGLAELDRGLYRTGAKSSRVETSAALDALDQGLGESASLEVDAGIFTDAPVRSARAASSTNPPIATLKVEREVTGWVAAAIMAVGLVLGAIAAVTVFHENVSHIVASWDDHR